MNSLRNWTVIAGLDPAIHFSKIFLEMDARVTPAHDIAGVDGSRFISSAGRQKEIA